MKLFRVIVLLLLAGTWLSSPPGTVHGKTRPIAAGDNFPAISFSDILSKGDRAYLGLRKKKTFSIADIHGDIFIIEIFSTYCMSCPANVPVLNTVYAKTNSDLEMRQRVKVLAVAIGNTTNESESYEKQHKVLFPILTDFTFALHKALGNPRVPYTIIVKRHARGNNVVVYAHMGVIESADSLLNEVQNLLRPKPQSS